MELKHLKYRYYSNLVNPKQYFSYVQNVKNLNLSFIFLIFVTIVIPNSVSAQWTTRDPRFYSREGVHDYYPPNPGDPDYR